MDGPVLDSFALLAYLRNEVGAGAVQEILEKAGRRGAAALMSEVNYAEVQYIVRRKDGDTAWHRVAEALDGLPLRFFPATRSLADRAAYFKADHKLSLADAFAAALAQERRVELVTGDPEFRPLAKEIRIRWIGPVTS